MSYISKRIIIIISMLCILMLAVGALLSNYTKSMDEERGSGINAEDLYKHKSKYIGDTSNVSNLLTKLPLAKFKKGISLATKSKPYGITVDYDLISLGMDMQQIELVFKGNALIMFALIENVDNITFDVSGTFGQSKYQYTRAEVRKSYNNIDPWEYSKDIEVFKNFLKELYSEPAAKEETQVAEYLKNIGRTAVVSVNHVEKKLADIIVEASNELFAGLTKYDSFFNNCPYWIGTREQIEDGTVIEERKYKIVGSEPQLVD